MILSISEIVDKASSLPNKKEKLEWLIKNKSVPLMTVLNIMYNKDIELLIPNTPPPWKKNGYVGVEGMLHKEARRLKIFVKGGGYDHLDRVKREKLFISLLEDIDDKDAELLCKMIAQKPLKGLSRQIVAEAFPELKLIRNPSDTNNGEEE
jgi:hypothetical protein